MVNALMVFVLARMAGEMPIAVVVALAKGLHAVDMESAWKESAFALVAGLVTDVNSELALEIATITGIATTVPAFAKMAIVVAIALFPVTTSLASAPFNAFGVA